MSPALQVALETLAARIETAARTGTPLRTAEAVALLRAGGMPRDQARRLLVTAGDGRWVLGRGQTTARGGYPPHILLPVSATFCGVLAAAKTRSGGAPECVDPRARLLAAARAVGFPRLEYVSGRIIIGEECFWERFAALATSTEIATALRALGVNPEEREPWP